MAVVQAEEALNVVVTVRVVCVAAMAVVADGEEDETVNLILLLVLP
jgi:hypothetical protein